MHILHTPHVYGRQTVQIYTNIPGHRACSIQHHHTIPVGLIIPLRNTPESAELVLTPNPISPLITIVIRADVTHETAPNIANAALENVEL